MSPLYCRYYLQHFCDSYRQAGIDLLQGQPISLESVDMLNRLAEEVHETACLVVAEAQECSPLDASLTPSLSHDLVNAPEIRGAAATYHVARLVPLRNAQIWGCSGFRQIQVLCLQHRHS